MSLFGAAAITFGVAFAQAPATETPAVTATEQAPVVATETKETNAETKTTDPKSKSTRPIPKLGVKEAKELCKKDGNKGSALATCIQGKVN